MKITRERISFAFDPRDPKNCCYHSKLVSALELKKGVVCCIFSALRIKTHSTLTEEAILLFLNWLTSQWGNFYRIKLLIKSRRFMCAGSRSAGVVFSQTS